MKIIKRILSFILVITIVFLVLYALPKPKYSRNNIWLKENNNDLPLVMAHGGGRGVYPGNTLSAFEYSYKLGADVLEMDVHMTADKVLVLRHGENETGNIRSMSNCDTVIWDETYDYLYNTCNFGYNFTDQDGNYPYRGLTKEEWIEEKVYMTTLEELFLMFGDNILYTIEIKADADAWRLETVDELYKLIEKYDLFDNVLAATSFTDISEYMNKTYPEMYLSVSQSEAQSMIISSYTFTSVFYKPDGYSALQIPTSFGLPVLGELNLATKLLVNTAHKQNMAVHYWTINDETTMKKLIELGCDGIITDYPELLIEVIKDYS